MCRRRFAASLGVVLVCAMAADAKGEHVLALHQGSNDPTTEGWIWNFFSSNPGAVLTGPVLNDLSPAYNAWKVDDNGAAPGDAGHYDVLLTAAQANEAFQYGWILSATLRAVDYVGGPNSASVLVGYYDTVSDKAYSLAVMGNSGNSDIKLWLPNGTTLDLPAIGWGYHEYKVAYDSASSSANLYVDGILKQSNLPTAPYGGATSTVLFGSGDSLDTGQGNYHEVSFSTNVPAPSTAVGLLGMGVIGAIGYFWRRFTPQ